MTAMAKILTWIFILAYTISMLAQSTSVEILPEIILQKVNYGYLHDVDSGDEAQIVSMLENEVANYYQDEYDSFAGEESRHEVYFIIQNGYIFAHYNSNGEVTRTMERFRNTKVPLMVSLSIDENYPGWIISKNTYLVSYVQNEGVAKTYKLILENGNHQIKVKTDCDGNIL